MGDSDEEDEGYNNSSGSARNGIRDTANGEEEEEEEEEEEGVDDAPVVFDFDADIANLKGRWLVERDEVRIYLIECYNTFHTD